jgi:hypothetical protein
MVWFGCAYPRLSRIVVHGLMAQLVMRMVVSRRMSLDISTLTRSDDSHDMISRTAEKL